MCSQNEGQSWTLDWTMHELSLNFQQSLIIPVQIILNFKCSKLHNNQDQPYVHTNFWLGMASRINPLVLIWSQQTPYIQNTVWNLQRNWKWEWKLKIMNKFEALSTSLSFFHSSQVRMVCSTLVTYTGVLTFWPSFCIQTGQQCHNSMPVTQCHYFIWQL